MYISSAEMKLIYGKGGSYIAHRSKGISTVKNFFPLFGFTLLGDYLKELQLSEGRGTGIPTIQDELRRNGSGPAVIETNEERSYFLIEIPCREGFSDRVLIGDDMISADDDKINDKINDKIKSVLLKISELRIAKKKDLHDAIKVSMSTIDRILKQLISEDLNLIEYQGSRKKGGYVLTEKGKAFVKSINVDSAEI